MKYLLILCLLISQLSFGQAPRLIGEKIFNDYSLFEENGKIGLVYIGERIVRDGDFDYFIQLPATFDTIIEEFDFFKCYTGETFRLYDPEFNEFIFTNYDLTGFGTFKQRYYRAAEIRTEKGRGILDESHRKILVPPEYDKIKFIDFVGNQQLFVAEKNGIGFLFLDSVRVRNSSVDKVKKLDDFFIEVSFKGKSGLYLVHPKKNPVNDENQITEILPIKFKKVDFLALDYSDSEYLISADNQKGLLYWQDTYVKMIIPVEYEKIDFNLKPDIERGLIASVTDLSGREGYLFYDWAGKPFQPIFMKAFKVNGDHNLVFQDVSGKWGIISAYDSVEIAVPAEYDQMLVGDETGRLSDHGVAVVRKGNKWGAINMINVIMAEIKYDKPSDIVLD